MGSLPPQLFKYIDTENIKAASQNFIAQITKVALDFHDQLAAGVPKDKIVMKVPHLFGMDIKLDYVASGSVGSVYKMQIGDTVFGLKINRRSEYGEMDVIANQSRARNLINKMYMGHVFEYNGRKHSWILSEYIAKDTEKSFKNAMEKLYYAYLTKGVAIMDAHPNNFKDGKLIDSASFSNRNGKMDDINNLTRAEIDIVKKLVNCIKTDNDLKFKDLITQVAIYNPAVINYMFFAMKNGKSPVFGVGKTDAFSMKLKKFDAIVNSAHKEFESNIVSFNKRKSQQEK